MKLQDNTNYETYLPSRWRQEQDLNKVPLSIKLMVLLGFAYFGGHLIVFLIK